MSVASDCNMGSCLTLYGWKYTVRDACRMVVWNLNFKMLGRLSRKRHKTHEHRPLYCQRYTEIVVQIWNNNCLHFSPFHFFNDGFIWQLLKFCHMWIITSFCFMWIYLRIHGTHAIRLGLFTKHKPWIYTMLAGATVPLLRYAPLTWQSGSQRRVSLWTIFVN